jgi:hypothetical protein
MQKPRVWREIRASVEDAIDGMAVVPIVPAGRQTYAADDDQSPKMRRDGTSSWSLFIRYVDARGINSERRITCRSLEYAIGGAPTINAICHERQALRAFRLDRVVEMIDLSTGEFVDPGAHFSMLRACGLPFQDRGIATFTKMLVFISFCDGYHPSEWVPIEQAITRYALRFGGDDRTVEGALKSARGLAPDSRDFLNCLGVLIRSPINARKQIARLALESCAAIIDADGRISDEEMHWGSAVSEALKRLAV